MHPKDCRVIALDLDGTLIDSRSDIARAANYALKTHGYPEQSTRAVASFVGDGAPKLIERASGVPIGSAEFEPLIQTFRDYYIEHAVVDTALYPGVAETLARLHVESTAGRWTLALCTNKPRSPTERVLSLMGLAHYFTVVMAGDDLPTRKPHPAMLQRIASRAGVTGGEVLMIGDGPQDVECGRRAGALTVGVTYGIKEAATMRAASPHFEIDRFDQLLSLLDL